MAFEEAGLQSFASPAVRTLTSNCVPPALHDLCRLSDGSLIELPTLLSAAWEEADGRFEHIRFVISSVSAEW